MVWQPSSAMTALSAWTAFIWEAVMGVTSLKERWGISGLRWGPSHYSHIGRKLIEIVEERLHVSVIVRPEGTINRFPFRRPCDQGIEQHFTNGFIEVLAYHDQRRGSVVVSANDLRFL